jgi:hypothetical protein
MRENEKMALPPLPPFPIANAQIGRSRPLSLKISGDWIEPPVCRELPPRRYGYAGTRFVAFPVTCASGENPSGKARRLVRAGNVVRLPYHPKRGSEHR